MELTMDEGVERAHQMDFQVGKGRSLERRGRNRRSKIRVCREEIKESKGGAAEANRRGGAEEAPVCEFGLLVPAVDVAGNPYLARA
jgi:hypothetical protein